MGACILLMGALAAFAVIASEMPSWLAWPLASIASMHAFFVTRREMRRAPIALLIASGNGVSTVDACAVEQLTVTWRGPLAFIAWRDDAGQRRRLSCWPDVLTPAARRELRLAAPATVAAPSTASVAP